MERQNLGTKIRTVSNILCLCLLLFNLPISVPRVVSCNADSLSPFLTHAIPDAHELLFDFLKNWNLGVQLEVELRDREADNLRSYL